MASTSLVDLPTELVLKIVRDKVLTQKDLYSLAVLSRRLNAIVTPILLSLLGFPNPKDTLKLLWNNKSFSPFRSHPSSALPNTNGRLPLFPIVDFSDEAKVDKPSREEDSLVRLEAAIVIAFQLPPVKNIVCTFPQTFTDLTNLILHLERFKTLLCRIKSVNFVTFNFTGDHRFRHLKSNPRSAVPVPFADIFGDIIQTLVRNGCEGLFLHNNSEQLQDDYRTLLTGEDRPLESRRPIAKRSAADDPPQPLTSKKESKNLFSRAKASLKAIFPAHHTSSSISPSAGQDLLYPVFDPKSVNHVNLRRGALREIDIQTPFALLPRCFPLIRDAIHSSLNTLTSITLSYILFDEALFDSCLLSLSLPKENAVTHLRIIHCHDIPPPSLLLFLKCFEARLEHLELDWHLAYIEKDEKMPGGGELRFQNLKTIIAPLDWISYIFKHAHAHSASGVVHLPGLSNMTIKCRLKDSFYFGYKVFAPLLDNILKPLYYQRPTSSRSSTQVQSKVNITLDIILDRNRPFQVELETVIMHYTLKPPPPTTTTPTSLADTSSRRRPRPPKHWDLISKLELYPTYPPMTESQAFSLAEWVTTVFPAVEQVTLPLPFIPRLMPIETYKTKQKDLADRGAEFLRDALRIRLLGYGEALAWKRLMVGPWILSLELGEER